MAASSEVPLLPSDMKCIVCHAPKDYRLETRPVPSITDQEVLVKVLSVGICAGDAKCFSGAPYFWGSDTWSQYVQPPVIPGHEFLGEVVRIGKGAKEKHGFDIGDHVISENIVPCWECRYCKRGDYNMCIPHYVYGFKQESQGAMAEYMKYPGNSIMHKVPKSIPAWKGAFIEPLACSVHAVELGNIQFNDVVVVSGCGPLGLGMVAAAAMKNPKLLIALDLLEWKLDVARECGAQVTLNPTKCNVIDEVKKLSEGYGCDVYIEATGSPVSVKQGLQMICRQGTFVEYSVFANETTADWTVISDAKELTIRGGHCSPYTYPQAIKMIEQNKLPLEKIITHKFPMSEVEKGLSLVNNSKESIKVILLPFDS